MKYYQHIQTNEIFAYDESDETATPYIEVKRSDNDFVEITHEQVLALLQPPPLTTEQLAESVRQQRNALLQASDWTQLPDVPESTKTAWAVYRDALRKVTEQPSFPVDVVWPTKPN